MSVLALPVKDRGYSGVCFVICCPSTLQDETDWFYIPPEH